MIFYCVTLYHGYVVRLTVSCPRVAMQTSELPRDFLTVNSHRMCFMYQKGYAGILVSLHEFAWMKGGNLIWYSFCRGNWLHVDVYDSMHVNGLFNTSVLDVLLSRSLKMYQLARGDNHGNCWICLILYV